MTKDITALMVIRDRLQSAIVLAHEGFIDSNELKSDLKSVRAGLTKVIRGIKDEPKTTSNPS